MFLDGLKEAAVLIEKELRKVLLEAKGPEDRLFRAMKYSVFAGGKRIRPFIVLASADIFGVKRGYSQRVAAAVELAHTYSLIHDDLPAMDDDNLRRGKATCHVEFDEATAILAGDALLTLAFEVLSEDETHSSAEIRSRLILEMAKAIGAKGMVGGQMLDLVSEKNDYSSHEIARLQRMKTGELIKFSCLAGAILGKAEKNQRNMLNAYAHDLGLAFQITDDLLDVEGNVKEVGKKLRKDNEAGKATFVSLLGAERAREQAEVLSDQAIKHLEIFQEKAEPLAHLMRYVIERRS